MGDTSAAKIQLTAQCAYLNLQEGKACEAILKETRELWQKSGTIQCQKDLKQVAQELTLVCHGKPVQKRPSRKPPAIDPDGINAPTL